MPHPSFSCLSFFWPSFHFGGLCKTVCLLVWIEVRIDGKRDNEINAWHHSNCVRRYIGCRCSSSKKQICIYIEAGQLQDSILRLMNESPEIDVTCSLRGNCQIKAETLMFRWVVVHPPGFAWGWPLPPSSAPHNAPKAKLQKSKNILFFIHFF